MFPYQKLVKEPINGKKGILTQLASANGSSKFEERKPIPIFIARIINLTMKTQFVTDDHGKKVAVILPIKEYQKMVEDMEELEDIRLYDEAKQEDDGKRILLSDYLKNRKAKNG
jgi:activator of HSP90 ATPase